MKVTNAYYKDAGIIFKRTTQPLMIISMRFKLSSFNYGSYNEGCCSKNLLDSWHHFLRMSVHKTRVTGKRHKSAPLRTRLHCSFSLTFFSGIFNFFFKFHITRSRANLGSWSKVKRLKSRRKSFLMERSGAENIIRAEPEITRGLGINWRKTPGISILSRVQREILVKKDSSASFL